MSKWKIHKSVGGWWYVATSGTYQGRAVYWVHAEFRSGAEAVAAFAAGGR